MEDIRNISDVRKERGIATELTKIADIVNEEIVIHGFEEQEGSFGTSVAIYATLEGEPIKILTTGRVLKSSLAQVEDALPVKATVKEVKGEKFTYYVLE